MKIICTKAGCKKAHFSAILFPHFFVILQKVFVLTFFRKGKTMIDFNEEVLISLTEAAKILPAGALAGPCM